MEAQEMTYAERIHWFVNHYYETGMEYEIVYESFKDKDLDNLEWYDDIIQIPKYKSMEAQEKEYRKAVEKIAKSMAETTMTYVKRGYYKGIAVGVILTLIVGTVARLIFKI